MIITLMVLQFAGVIELTVTYLLDVRTRCAPILKLLRGPSFISAIMVLRAGVSLSAKARWSLTGLGFVVAQDVIRVLEPLYTTILFFSYRFMNIHHVCRGSLLLKYTTPLNV